MNRKDLQALTLVGPTRNNLELDPLAVLHLDNKLFRNGVMQICQKFDPLSPLTHYIPFMYSFKAIPPLPSPNYVTSLMTAPKKGKLFFLVQSPCLFVC